MSCLYPNHPLLVRIMPTVDRDDDDESRADGQLFDHGQVVTEGRRVGYDVRRQQQRLLAAGRVVTGGRQRALEPRHLVLET